MHLDHHIKIMFAMLLIVMLFWLNIYILVLVYSFFDKNFFKINFVLVFSLAKTTILVLVLVFPMY